MAFNMDADPRNRDWLRSKAWLIPAETLPELLAYLGVEDQPVEDQVQAVETFVKSSSFEKSPALLKQQADEFINGFEIDELSEEVK